MFPLPTHSSFWPFSFSASHSSSSLLGILLLYLFYFYFFFGTFSSSKFIPLFFLLTSSNSLYIFLFFSVLLPPVYYLFFFCVSLPYIIHFLWIYTLFPSLLYSSSSLHHFLLILVPLLVFIVCYDLLSYFPSSALHLPHCFYLSFPYRPSPWLSFPLFFILIWLFPLSNISCHPHFILSTLPFHPSPILQVTLHKHMSFLLSVLHSLSSPLPRSRPPQCLASCPCPAIEY